MRIERDFSFFHSARRKEGEGLIHRYGRFGHIGNADSLRRYGASEKHDGLESHGNRTISVEQVFHVADYAILIEPGHDVIDVQAPSGLATNRKGAFQKGEMVASGHEIVDLSFRTEKRNHRLFHSESEKLFQNIRGAAVGIYVYVPPLFGNPAVEIGEIQPIGRLSPADEHEIAGLRGRNGFRRILIDVDNSGFRIFLR